MSAERERTELDTIKLLELLVKIAGADEQVRSNFEGHTQCA